MQTNYLNYYKNLFSQVYIDKKALELKSLQEVIKKLKDFTVYYIDSEKEIPKEHQNKTSLFITIPKGRVVGACPGSKGHICCNYLTVDLYLGCTLGCSYCIMKSYLNFSPITVYVDPAPAVKRLREIAESNPQAIIRAGTGEVGDSLQLDPLFDFTKYFISGLSDLKNIYFEAKTKTDFIDHLIDIPEKGNAVIGFSINPDEVIKVEEEFAVSLDRRLKAAKKAIEGGYLVSFHFDPIFYSEKGVEPYLGLIEKLAVFPEDKIAWISLGTFRFTPGLKDKMDDRPYLYDEFVPCKDGKMRYLQKERSVIYKKMLERIKSIFNVKVYMCMESPAVWKKVFGKEAEEINELNPIFNKIDL